MSNPANTMDARVLDDLMRAAVRGINRRKLSDGSVTMDDPFFDEVAEAAAASAKRNVSDKAAARAWFEQSAGVMPVDRDLVVEITIPSPSAPGVSKSEVRKLRFKKPIRALIGS